MAGSITTTTAAAFIPEIWSNEVIDAYTNNVVLADLVDRSFQELVKEGHGDTINVPNVSSYSSDITTISQGSNVAQITPATESLTPIVVQTWQGVRYSYPDVVLVQSMNSLRQSYTEMMGKDMAKVIDTSLATLVASISQNVGTLAVKLTDSNIRRAIQYLDDANAPDTDRFLVVCPAQFLEFMDEEKYVNSLYSSSIKNLQGDKGKGYKGDIYDFGVYQSTNVVSSGGGHNNAMFQRKWAALVIQKGPVVEEWRDVKSLQDEVVIHALWGVKEMRATSGVYMKGL